jgi:hypothetical protein
VHLGGGYLLVLRMMNLALVSYILTLREVNARTTRLEEAWAGHDYCYSEEDIEGRLLYVKGWGAFPAMSGRIRPRR